MINKVFLQEILKMIFQILQLFFKSSFDSDFIQNIFNQNIF